MSFTKIRKEEFDRLSIDEQTKYVNDFNNYYDEGQKQTNSPKEEKSKEQVELSSIAGETNTDKILDTLHEQNKKKINSLADGWEKKISTFLSDFSENIKRPVSSFLGQDRKSYLNDDELSRMSSFNDTLDTRSITETIGDWFAGNEHKRAFKNQKDKDNYIANIESVLGDKYEYRWDKDQEIEIRPKGSDKEYRKALPDITDSSLDEIGTRIEANLPIVVGEIVGDVAGAKKGFEIANRIGAKNPIHKGAIAIAGAIVGSSIGGLIGTETQSKINNEKISDDTLKDIEKSQILDNLTLNLVGAGVFKTSSSIANKVGDFLNLDKKAHRFYDDKLNDLDVKQRVQLKSDIATLSDSFGAVDSNLNFMAGATGNTQSVLNNVYMKDKNLAKIKVAEDNSILTANLKTKLNLNDNESKDVFNFFQGGIEQIQKSYKNMYQNTIDEIKTITKDEKVDIGSKVFETTMRLKESLPADKSLIDDDSKKYLGILNDIEDIFKNADDSIDSSVQISKLIELNKDFNRAFYKNQDSFTKRQKDNLSSIKSSIYEDIENYINKTAQSQKDELFELWNETNRQYKNWFDTVNSDKMIKAMTDNKLDKYQTDHFFNDLFKQDQNSKLDSFVGKFAEHYRKMQGDVAMDSFYQSFADAIIKKSSKQIRSQNQTKDIIDFGEFNKIWDNLDETTKDKLFVTDTGKRYRETLDNFATISANESKLQQSILDGFAVSDGSVASAEQTKKLLYSVGYAIKSMFFDKGAKYFSNSLAFDNYIERLAVKSRYKLIDKDEAIKTLKETDAPKEDMKAVQSALDKAEKISKQVDTQLADVGVEKKETIKQNLLQLEWKKDSKKFVNDNPNLKEQHQKSERTTSKTAGFDEIMRFKDIEKNIDKKKYNNALDKKLKEKAQKVKEDELLQEHNDLIAKVNLDSIDDTNIQILDSFEFGELLATIGANVKGVRSRLRAYKMGKLTKEQESKLLEPLKLAINHPKMLDTLKDVFESKIEVKDGIYYLGGEEMPF
jgi:hypothetical protein